MIVKLHAFFGDLADPGEGEDLEAAAIGEDGFVPVCKLVQSAGSTHDLHARPHKEVISVSQNDLCTERLQLHGMDSFHRGLRADGHEDGRLDRAMRGVQPAAARGGFRIGG